MAAKALPFIPAAIKQVSVCTKSADFDHGILITFSDNRTAYYDGSWLYDQRDVCGNFVVNEDEPDI